MKKTVAVITAVFIMLAVVPFVTADSDKAVAPEITIDKIAKKFPGVVLKHKDHQKRMKGDCTACHHKSKKGETPKACSECHGKVEGAPGLKMAFHKQCKGCHKAKKAEGIEAPTKCTGCHKK